MPVKMPYWSCCLCSEWCAPTQENCGECVHAKCKTCKIHWDMLPDACKPEPSKIPVIGPHWSCCLCNEWNSPIQENCGECVHAKCNTCKLHWDMLPDNYMLVPSKIPIRDIHVFKSGRRVRYHSIRSSFESLIDRFRSAPRSPSTTPPNNSSTTSLATDPSADSSSSSFPASSETSPDEQFDALTMPEVLELFNQVAAASPLSPRGSERDVAEMHRRAMAAWERASEAKAIYTWEDYVNENGYRKY